MAKKRKEKEKEKKRQAKTCISKYLESYFSAKSPPYYLHRKMIFQV
jgi:hypothetical protein